MLHPWACPESTSFQSCPETEEHVGRWTRFAFAFCLVLRRCRAQDDTCESEVPLPPQLPYVAEEKMREREREIATSFRASPRPVAQVRAVVTARSDCKRFGRWGRQPLQSSLAARPHGSCNQKPDASHLGQRQIVWPGSWEHRSGKHRSQLLSLS